jgi:hypothetical protein
VGPTVELCVLEKSLRVAKKRLSNGTQVCGSRGGTVGRGTALQAGRSRVRFPISLL